LLRTHVGGGAIALRFDAPAFALEKEKYLSSPYAYGSTEPTRIQRSSVWMPVVGATFSLRF